MTSSCDAYSARAPRIDPLSLRERAGVRGKLRRLSIALTPTLSRREREKRDHG
jgi:hypothetical protein